MSNTAYQFKQIDAQRWGIYFQNRLLATVGSYEVGRSIWQSLNNNLSQADYLKVAISPKARRGAIAYKQGINHSLLVDKPLFYR